MVYLAYSTDTGCYSQPKYRTLLTFHIIEQTRRSTTEVRLNFPEAPMFAPRYTAEFNGD